MAQVRIVSKRAESEAVRQHCAHMSKIAAAKKREDFTGLAFGRLIGVEPDKTNPRYWLFRCECGSDGFRARKDSVKAGLIKSCGCLLRETASARGRLFGPLTAADLVGRKFGMLTAVERAGSKSGNALWRCACDCGGEKVVPAALLVRGDVASCGCAAPSGLVVRPAESRARTRAYNRDRRSTDVSFALKHRVLSAFHQSLKRRGGKKMGRWSGVLGYGVDQLKDRLASTMPDGYSWDDFLSGRLHIDHIVPLAAFNYERETDIDFHRAWALSNLRLLPALENLTKSARLEEPFQPSLCF